MEAEKHGRLRERLAVLRNPSLIIVDGETSYLPITAGGTNLFFQLVNARYEKGSIILTVERQSVV